MIITLSISILIVSLIYALVLLLTGLAIAEGVSYGVSYRDYRATKKRRQRIIAIANSELKKVA